MRSKVRASKRSPVPTKKEKIESTATELVPDEKWFGIRKLKTFKPHHQGYCKTCHKHVKNLEAHTKVKHRRAKIR